MKLPETQATSGSVATWQDSRTEPLPPWYCSSSEDKQPSMSTNVATDYRASKDNFISTVGLWPKNISTQISEKRNTEGRSANLDEYISSLATSQTAECLISHLDVPSSESCGVAGRRRCTLISSLSSRNDKGTGDRSEDIEDKYNKINNVEVNTKLLQARSLYKLDLTSPLGQFVIRHIKGDSSLRVLSDVEGHCLSCTPNKSAAVIRLRERHITYPITFKGFSGKLSCSHVHRYSFTRRQKVEFMLRVNTGLDKKSRTLFKKLQPCQVRLTQITKADMTKWMLFTTNKVMVKLKPLSVEEIDFWTSPKVIPSSNVLPAFCCSTLPPSHVQTICRTDDVPCFNRHHLGNLWTGHTPFEVTTSENTVQTSPLSDFSHENELSQTENSPLLIPSIPNFTLQEMMSSSSGPCRQALRHTHILPDITNTKFDATVINAVKYPALCQASSFIMKENGRVDRLKPYMFSKKCFNYRRTLDSSLSISTKYSGLHGFQESLTYGASKIGKYQNGPVRSGIYNVHIWTSADGKVIRNLLLKLQTGCANRHSQCKNSKEVNATSLVRAEENTFGIMPSS